MENIIMKLDLLIENLHEEDVVHLAKEIKRGIIEKEFWSHATNSIKGEINE